MTSNAASHGSSIEKALSILDAFLPHNEAVGTTELSRRLGMHKATVSRILVTLASKGYLQQDLKTKKYTLGFASVKLGNAVAYSLRCDVVPAAKPVVDALRDVLDETVTLEVAAGAYSVMAYVAKSSHFFNVAAEVGGILPSHAAAGPKSILAFAPPEIAAKCLEENPKAYTPKTIVNPDDFLQCLDQVRQRGYATDLGETESGINAYAVPVFNHQARAVAAVVVVGPESRIPGQDPEALISRLKGAAQDISIRLHYERGRPA
jgi:IclR family KDG regulon transcriptional repressor